MTKLNKLIYTALSQVGVTEKSPNNVLYNTWYYGREVNDSAGTGAYAWCVVFLSWCAAQTGLSDSIPKENNVSDLMDHYQKLDRYIKRDDHIPTAGDIIFFRTSSGTGRHVGLVLATDGTRVATVEGNTSNAVKIRTYALSDSTITGWGIPEYPTDEDESNLEKEDELNLMELKKGDSGNAVRAMQIALLYDGYALGATGTKQDGVDGKFGGKTREAVIAFQKKHGIASSGVADVQTLSVLYGLN